MQKANLIVVGGFLGAGKTTCILGMARHLLGMGKKIGIVTNDQGSRLVDTSFLTKEGLPVLEVTGGCFCCNFEEFTDRVNRLAESEMPDVILAEPVGSCTDLIATIFKPMQLKYTKRFVMNPLSIAVDPKRVKSFMLEKNSGGFAGEINYLFQKQLEEADLIVLNKIDLLPKEEVSEITDFLKNYFKGTDVLAVSAKEGIGIDRWISVVSGAESGLHNLKEIDYDIYAEAEANLGWLNSSAILDADRPVEINEFVKELMENIREQFKLEGHEIAHLKIYGAAGEDWTKASLTSTFDEVDFNRRMKDAAKQMSIIINARANAVPERLKPLVEGILADICRRYHIRQDSLSTECFKPGRPQPKYRIMD